MNSIKLGSVALAVVMCSAAVFAQEKDKTAASAALSPDKASETRKSDHAASYYHFAMAHMYEEMINNYGRGEYATKAIEEYKLAIAADPASDYLTDALADLYHRTGRIRDAVSEAQQAIRRDPNNLEAHKLLGRIYLRSLRDS